MTTNIVTESELTFGTMKKATNGMPVLELLLDDTLAGYLSPSNLDGFKITSSVEESATLKGCQRIDMRELASSQIGMELIQAHAKITVIKFAIQNSEHELPSLELGEAFKMISYVGRCITWINEQN